MAGNVGEQSSEIIVQGLANNDVKGSVNKSLDKRNALSIFKWLYIGLIFICFLFGFMKEK